MLSFNDIRTITLNTKCGSQPKTHCFDISAMSYFIDKKKKASLISLITAAEDINYKTIIDIISCNAMLHNIRAEKWKDQLYGYVENNIYQSLEHILLYSDM